MSIRGINDVSIDCETQARDETDCRSFPTLFGDSEPPFKWVMWGLYRLSQQIIKPLEEIEMHPYVHNHPKYYPWFKVSISCRNTLFQVYPRLLKYSISFLQVVSICVVFVSLGLHRCD